MIFLNKILNNPMDIQLLRHDGQEDTIEYILPKEWKRIVKGKLTNYQYLPFTNPKTSLTFDTIYEDDIPVVVHNIKFTMSRTFNFSQSDVFHAIAQFGEQNFNTLVSMLDLKEHVLVESYEFCAFLIAMLMLTGRDLKQTFQIKMKNNIQKTAWTVFKTMEDIIIDQ